MTRHGKVLVVTCMALFCLEHSQLATPYADGSAARPTIEEIRAVESQIRKPHGARSLRHYVRYYYARQTPTGRVISAIYIEKFWFVESGAPAKQIVIVDGQNDIPDVEDGECSVLYVEYDPRGHEAPTVGCSGGVLG
jgi:hypothetical protein